MKGGSLENRLRAHKAQNPLPALTWQQRFNISHGIARWGLLNEMWKKIYD